MARVEEIERRLLNWARWRVGAGSGGMGYASASMGSLGSSGGYREAVVPTVDCEAEETDQAVQALAPDLRETVELVYAHGGGMAGKARRLGCSERAVYLRVEQAHVRLQVWLHDLQAARRQQRERVEALQRQARP